MSLFLDVAVRIDHLNHHRFHQCFVSVTTHLWIKASLVYFSAYELVKLGVGDWAGSLHIHFCGLLPLTDFCQVQNSLGVQILRYPRPIGSVITRHSSSGRQPNFAAFSRAYHQGGLHVGHRPIF